MNDTEKELIALLREEVRVTPGYAADKIGKRQPYTSQLLAGLVDDGYAEKVDRGLYGLGPKAPERLDDSGDGELDDVDGGEGGAEPEAPEPGREFVEPDRQEPPSGEPTPTAGGEASTGGGVSGIPVSETALREMAAEHVEQLELPGRGSRLEARREAITDMYIHVLREGNATKAELKQYVDTDKVGYEAEENFFTNVIRGGSGKKYSPVFGQLPGVERPAKGGKDYRIKP